MLLVYPEIDDLICLTLRASLIKNSEECVKKSHDWTKIKKQEDTQMHQTVPVLCEAENKKSQFKKQLNDLIFIWAFLQSARDQYGKWTLELAHSPLENMMQKKIFLLSLKRWKILKAWKFEKGNQKNNC